AVRGGDLLREGPDDALHFAESIDGEADQLVEFAHLGVLELGGVERVLQQVAGAVERRPQARELVFDLASRRRCYVGVGHFRLLSWPDPGWLPPSRGVSFLLPAFH